MLRKLSILFFFFLFLGMSVKADPPCIDCGEDPDAEIPIDGGISVLAAAGIAYGAHTLRKKKTVSE